MEKCEKAEVGHLEQLSPYAHYLLVIRPPPRSHHIRQRLARCLLLHARQEAVETRCLPSVDPILRFRGSKRSPSVHLAAVKRSGLAETRVPVTDKCRQLKVTSCSVGGADVKAVDN